MSKTEITSKIAIVTLKIKAECFDFNQRRMACPNNAQPLADVKPVITNTPAMIVALNTGWFGLEYWLVIDIVIAMALGLTH